MLLTEYRIPFPSTVDEYRIGMMYMIARATTEELRRGDGRRAVELLTLEKYTENDHGLEPGIYSEKVFHIENFLPRFLRPFVPSSKAKLIEKAWAAYPDRCLTLYSTPILGEKPFMSIESRYLSDRGGTENALALGEKDLAVRNIVTLDIAAEDCLRMSSDADVRGFWSKKAGRGELIAGIWTRTSDPVMCSYKVCRLDIAQPRLEAWGQRFLQNSFIQYNRHVFVWMDSWFGLRLRDIPGALPMPPEKTRTMVATELAAEFGVCPALEMFDRSDASNPFV